MHGIYIYYILDISNMEYYTDAVDSIIPIYMLKGSGCLEVKEWELGDLTDTKSG